MFLVSVSRQFRVTSVVRSRKIEIIRVGLRVSHQGYKQIRDLAI